MSEPALQAVEAARVYSENAPLLDRRFVRSLIYRATLRTDTAVFDEDLEQEALLRLCRAIVRTRHIRHPKAFAVKIVRDAVSDHWRSRRVFEALESIPEHMLSVEWAMEARMDEQRRLCLLYSALDRLGARKREVLESFYFREDKITRIAERLPMTPSAVKMTLHRGKRELRAAVGVCPS